MQVMKLTTVAVLMWMNVYRTFVVAKEPNGYRLNSLIIECKEKAVNECDDSPCGRHKDTIVNVLLATYEFDGTTWVDKNECMYQVRGNGFCINTDGSYQC